MVSHPRQSPGGTGMTTTLLYGAFDGTGAMVPILSIISFHGRLPKLTQTQVTEQMGRMVWNIPLDWESFAKAELSNFALLVCAPREEEAGGFFDEM